MKHPTTIRTPRLAARTSLARGLAAAAAGFAVVLAAGGCQRTRADAPYVEVPAGSFAQAWSADLGLSPRERVVDITPLGELLIVRTSNNTAYALSAAGGTLRWASQVHTPGLKLGAPVMAGQRIVFPALDRLIVYTPEGRREKEISLDRAIRSPLSGDGDFVYCGFDYIGQGRMGRVSLTQAYVPVRWELMTNGAVSGAPGVFQDVIFAGSEDGNVYAVSEQRNPVWALPGNVFSTGGPITADVKADDTGVYVASGDSKLYALDRATGRIRWQYHAGQPLRNAPLVTGDTVYQFVPGEGVAAIEKVGGAYNRQPKWFSNYAIQALAQDARHVFVRGTDDSVIAVDRQSGKPQFKTERRDLRFFAGAADGSLVYTATERGQILGVRPVTSGGTVGQLVSTEATDGPRPGG